MKRCFGAYWSQRAWVSLNSAVPQVVQSASLYSYERVPRAMTITRKMLWLLLAEGGIIFKISNILKRNIQKEVI
jgi:hypothetical protein